MSKPRYCSASGCMSNSYFDANLSFFRFPKDQNKCDVWVRNCGRNNFKSTDSNYLYENCRLCSLHFDKCMFAGMSQNRLKQFAIPHIFKSDNDVMNVSPLNQQSAPENISEVPNIIESNRKEDY